jgi:hypothetical protein
MSMNEHERKGLVEMREITEAHFELAMREKDEEKLTRMGLILDGLTTVDSDRETFEEAFERVVRPHMRPAAPPFDEDFGDDTPF